jgi:PAS domain-containing protein
MLRILPIAGRIGGSVALVMYFVLTVVNRKLLASNWKSAKTNTLELKSIIDAFPGGICLVKNGMYSMVNQYVADTIGRPASEVIGNKIGKRYATENSP